MLAASPALAQDYFDPGLLSLGGTHSAAVDLSAFGTSGQTPPGTYTVSLFINQIDQGQHTLIFKADTNGDVQPQLTPDLLHQLGVNTQVLPTFAGLPAEEPVDDLAALIPEATLQFDLAQLRLDISIPQVAMQPNAQGAVDPALWEHGVPAMVFNYNLNGGRNWQSEQAGMVSNTQTNLFANLQGGVNWQAWRLRSNLAYSRNTNSQSNDAVPTRQSTQFSSTYLQRDIQAWRSEILLGENNTENDVFDCIPFRGVKLNSSEEMLPTSLRGFAPIISGIAQTNARVTVSQNGNIVYQTYVAPGPFRINDLFQTGQAGDLLLTIHEADGTVRTQALAFSSLPVMRRQGSLKYEVTAGRYNGGITQGSQQAEFVLGTAIYGLPHDITLYGGALLAEDYTSVVAGSGFSLGNFGALSADITASNAKLHGQEDHQQGYSYRLRYAKSLLSTGTAVDLTAYRYSTRHYYSFADFNNLGFQLSDGQVPWALERKRSDFQIRLTQQLDSWGSLYLSAARNDFWGNDKVVHTVSAGYNGSYRGVSYGLAYSIDRLQGDGSWPENRQFSLNMQVPLNLFGSSPALRNTYASYQMTSDNQGRVQQQSGISGSAFDSRLSYSALQGWSNGQGNNSSTLNTSYQGSKGSASMGYSYNSQNRSLNLSGNGGIVVHPEGVTFSQMLGNSVAVVSAPGAKGTSVMNGDIRTDSRGYAVVPYLSSYQLNNVGLNPATLPDNVDINQSSLNVYPTKGAVVVANFATQVGYQVLMTLQLANNTPVPFGALATVENTAANKPNTSIVGEAGQVYLSGLPEQGKLKVTWGKEANQQCLASFDLKNAAAPSANNPIHMLSVACQGK